MLGVIAFIVSVISVIMSFFSSLLKPSFMIAIMGIIIAVISAYDKDVTDKQKETKDSRALEIGAMIISAATTISYFIFTIIA